MRARGCHPFRAAALLLAGAASALLPAAPSSAAAGAWRGSASAAGAYGADGRAVLELACTGPGALRLTALSPGLSARGGNGHSLVLGIDGTAFLFQASGDGPGRLAASLSGARAALVVASLRKGKAAELRVPAGRYAVPLAGSGAALQPLQAGCGLAPAG